MVLTQKNILDYVKRKFGYPTIYVELEDSHIIQAIDDALLLFNRYIGEYEVRVYPNQSENMVVVLDDDVRSILQVQTILPREDRSYTQLNVFELMYRMVYPELPIGEYYMIKSFYDTYLRIRGAEPDYIYRDFEKKLYVDCWAGPWDVQVTLIKDITLTTLQTGRPSHEKSFLDAVMAYSKQMLAMIRGKFAGSIPAPGGSLATDADILRQEAAVAVEKVEATLETEARYETTIIWGG